MSLLENPIRAAICLVQLDADLGVVARVALADVVQQRTDDQQIGAVDPIGQRGGVDGRLEQVTVDGEAVVGVALGSRADRRPLGQQPGQEVLLVERLHRGDRRASGTQRPDQRLSGLERPRVR
jgi:hypothetical protein